VETLLKGFKYTQWGTDDLKSAVATKNLDIALVYSGDFFDSLYFAMENNTEVTFDLFVDQQKNNVWFDTMAIPKTVPEDKIDLAHAFINFFLDEDNALENASYIGYCPPITAVYEAIIEDIELSPLVTHPGYYPGNIVNGQVYRHLGVEIAQRMDEILNRAKIK
jgi:spermidine/putrescine-binding protein